MLVEKLTEKDIDMIDYYRNEFADRDGYASNRDKADIKYVLREWDTAKSDFLYKLFGEKFIVRKPIELEQNKTEIESEFYNINIDMGRPYDKFKNKFFSLLTERAELVEKKYDLMDLTTVEVILSNEVPACLGTIKIKFPNETNPYKICPGAKVMKVLGKFAKIYGIEEQYEQLRILQSRATNQKKTHGNLCLSIHPLDYMTMSDNDCGWSSCMSWMDDEGGEYSQGTVEMMNSNSVIVAYIESNTPMRLNCRFEWNSKKWRELFVVNPDFFVGVKGYPYRSSKLQDEVSKFIKELAAKNCGLSYNQTCAYDGEYIRFPVEPDSKRYSFYFNTKLMYNDFGTSETEHTIYAIDGWDAYKFMECNSFDYSGSSECMWCGEITTYICENSRVCENCSHTTQCAICGGRFDEGEISYIDGEPVCEYCLEHEIYEDALTNELHFSENMTKIYLSRYNTGDGPRQSTKYIYVYYVGDFIRECVNEYSDLTNNVRSFYTAGYSSVSDKWFDHYYVNLNDLNKYGRNLFNVDYLSDDFFVDKDGSDICDPRALISNLIF